MEGLQSPLIHPLMAGSFWNPAKGPLKEEGQSKDIPGWKALYKSSTLSNPEYITIC